MISTHLSKKQPSAPRPGETQGCICALLFQCKHILAVYLCQAMGVTQQESVSDQQMSVILSGADTA